MSYVIQIMDTVIDRNYELWETLIVTLYSHMQFHSAWVTKHWYLTDLEPTPQESTIIQ